MTTVTQHRVQLHLARVAMRQARTEEERIERTKEVKRIMLSMLESYIDSRGEVYGPVPY